MPSSLHWNTGLGWVTGIIIVWLIVDSKPAMLPIGSTIGAVIVNDSSIGALLPEASSEALLSSFCCNPVVEDEDDIVPFCWWLKESLSALFVSNSFAANANPQFSCSCRDLGILRWIIAREVRRDCWADSTWSIVTSGIHTNCLLFSVVDASLLCRYAARVDGSWKGRCAFNVCFWFRGDRYFLMGRCSAPLFHAACLFKLIPTATGGQLVAIA